jgi:prophage antirepressor-like protein
MEIIPFEYKSNRVRVIKDEHGEPQWVAKDVCFILGISQYRDALSRLDADERGSVKLDTPGGSQDVATVNEPGLYTLIIRSNKPEAKKFRKWITQEVLPTIRKTGRYEISELSELDLIIRSARALKKIEQKQLEHDKRLSSIEAKSHQNSGQTGYWTITAWCKLNNLNLSLVEAMQKGRAASRLSSEWDVSVGQVPDERFGVVNSYREDVLEEVFGIEVTTG